MEKSRFLAGLIGPTVLVVAATVVVNRAILPELAQTVSRDYALIMMSGALVLVPGLAILLTHRVWRGWPLIITLVGVVAVIGGAVRLVFPATVADLALHAASAANGAAPLIAAAILTILGAFLTFQAFKKA